MITELKLKNFTAFDDLEIQFSPKINVIIGENGTGKTLLLKVAYSLCAGNIGLKAGTQVDSDKIRRAVTSKLLRVFMPMNDKIGKMRKIGSTEGAQFEVGLELDKKLSASFKSNSKYISIGEDFNYINYDYTPIFIPTKEVLSLIQGVAIETTDQETLKRIFDDTYLDLCDFVRRPVKRLNNEELDIDPRFGSIFPEIVNTIGGKYIFDNGKNFFRQGKYEERRVRDQHNYGDKTETVFKHNKDAEISNNMTAEGFRKIGILQQLLANGSLKPGSSGPLYWDEPEANMNPSLMKLIVRVLLSLARNGQQVIVSTHDYFLLKWFDILFDKGKDDHVRFHALYHDPDNKEIKIDSTDKYREISPNSIAETFSNLTDYEISKSMGGLGK